MKSNLLDSRIKRFLFDTLPTVKRLRDLLRAQTDHSNLTKFQLEQIDQIFECLVKLENGKNDEADK
jgi:hypothetical protein